MYAYAMPKTPIKAADMRDEQSAALLLQQRILLFSFMTPAGEKLFRTFLGALHIHCTLQGQDDMLCQTEHVHRADLICRDIVPEEEESRQKHGAAHRADSPYNALHIAQELE